MNVRFAGLDSENETDRALLFNLQGNIVSGHGRTHSALVIVDFHKLLLAGHPFRRWIHDFAVTDALVQDASACAKRKPRTGPSSLFRGAYLTSLGYDRLGLPRSQVPGDIAFREGARGRARRIGDGKFCQWESWATGPTGMVILVAHNQAKTLDTATSILVNEIGEYASAVSVAQVLRGSSLREKGLPREPFGFADGISQPLFLRRHIERFMAAEPEADWDPTANPRHLVLAPELSSSGAWGSYLVVRKLTQDVEAFNASVQTLSASLGIDKNLAEAFALGRHKDGTPVSDHAQPQGNVSNGFTYDDDPHGGRCPMQSHIRRMNPRTSDPDAISRRIVRRGFSFEGKDGEGLIFLSFQQDISRQFEFMQRVWGNNQAGDHLVDPLIGTLSRHFTWPKHWNAPPQDRTSVGFRKSVRLDGSLYLFAPSISFLRSLL